MAFALSAVGSDEGSDERRSGERAAVTGSPERSWEEIYEAHFDFVWRSLRRLGVAESALDDATQEVFLVAFRRAHAFEGRSSFKTWLFGIAWNVARRLMRGPERREDPLPEVVPDAMAHDQEEVAARAEAVRALYEVLGSLNEDKRAVFVMAELEEMSAPEIAEITGVPLNTVYSRLRAARIEFDAALKRRRTRDEWRRP